MTTDDIIASNTGLIYKIMNENFYGVEREDLFQAGVVGLLKAYKNYQADGNVKFSTYAFSAIFGEMYQFAMQKQIKVSRDYLRLYKNIESTRYSLAQKWGYIPSNEELACFLEEDVNKIEQAILAGSIIVGSLDMGTEEDRSIYETIPTEEVISLDDKMIMNECLDQLSDDERKIIEYRYLQGMTQSEVARILKKNQVMISRYEKRSIEKMQQFAA